MNARLLLVNPEDVQEPPFAPSLITERDGMLYVLSDGWAPPLKPGVLAEITENDLLDVLRLRPGERIYLTSMREIPPNLSSEAFLTWTRDWWLQAVSELTEKVSVAKAS